MKSLDLIERVLKGALAGAFWTYVVLTVARAVS